MRRSVVYGIVIALVALVIGSVIGRSFASYAYADYVAEAEIYRAERLQLANAVDSQGQRISRAKELLQELSGVLDIVETTPAPRRNTVAKNARPHWPPTFVTLPKKLFPPNVNHDSIMAVARTVLKRSREPSQF